jgi:hypothetical protein
VVRTAKFEISSSSFRYFVCVGYPWCGRHNLNHRSPFVRKCVCAHQPTHTISLENRPDLLIESMHEPGMNKNRISSLDLVVVNVKSLMATSLLMALFEGLLDDA